MLIQLTEHAHAFIVYPPGGSSTAKGYALVVKPNRAYNSVEVDIDNRTS